MSDIVTLNGYKIKDEKAVRSYETVALMKADTKLKEGQHIKTRGYYNINDGGSAEYYITSSQSETEYQEELGNGLYASLIVEDVITPEIFGAKGDGVTDDSIALQKWLDNHITNKNYIFDIPSKTYAISTGLTINYEEENFLIDFKNATIKATELMNFMLSINTISSDVDFGTDIGDKYRTVQGGHWESNNLADDIIFYRARRVIVQNMHLLNAKEKYLNIERGSIIFKNSFLDRRNYSITNSTGIYIGSNSSDSKISDVQARDVSIFTNCGGNSVYYRNCHAWLVNILNDTVFCKYSRTAIFSDCYPDTYNTVLEGYTNNIVMFIGGTIFWNTGLLPNNYSAPYILKHGTEFSDPLNVRFVGTNFDLYSLYTAGITAIYSDDVYNTAWDTTMVNYNKINLTHITGYSKLMGYHNIDDIETITERGTSGTITYSEVRHIGNGFIYVKGKFTNTYGQVDPNFGFATISTNNITISETAYINGVVYNSSTPNNKQPIVIDINTGGFLHTFVPATISDIDRIEFSGIIRCDLRQGF